MQHTNEKIYEILASAQNSLMNREIGGAATFFQHLQNMYGVSYRKSTGLNIYSSSKGKVFKDELERIVETDINMELLGKLHLEINNQIKSNPKNGMYSLENGYKTDDVKKFFESQSINLQHLNESELSKGTNLQHLNESELLQVIALLNQCQQTYEQHLLLAQEEIKIQNRKNEINNIDIKSIIYRSVIDAHSLTPRRYLSAQRKQQNPVKHMLFSQELITSLAFDIAQEYCDKISIDTLNHIKEQLSQELKVNGPMLEILRTQGGIPKDENILQSVQDHIGLNSKDQKEHIRAVSNLLGAKLQILLQQECEKQKDSIENLYKCLEEFKSKVSQIGTKSIDATESTGKMSEHGKELFNLLKQQHSNNQANDILKQHQNNEVNRILQKQNAGAEIINGIREFFKSLYDLIANFCKEIGRYFYQGNEAAKTSKSYADFLSGIAKQSKNYVKNI